MRRRRTGHTLIEVVVASAIFAVFLTVATDLFVSATRTTNSGELRGLALDQASNVLYRLTAELRDASAILDPSTITLLQPAGSPFIVLSTLNGGSTQVVAYRLVPDPSNPHQTELQRFLYANDYVSGVPATQQAIPGSHQIMATSNATLSFSLGTGSEASTVAVVVSITPPQTPPLQMRTRVTMRRSLFPGP